MRAGPLAAQCDHFEPDEELTAGALTCGAELQTRVLPLLLLLLFEKWAPMPLLLRLAPCKEEVLGKDGTVVLPGCRSGTSETICVPLPSLSDGTPVNLRFTTFD